MCKRMVLLVAFYLLAAPLNIVLAASGDVASAPGKICPILVGNEIPQIVLEDIDGKRFELAKAIRNKPTVLIYFRGGW